jgi:hypothetical protein
MLSRRAFGGVSVCCPKEATAARSSLSLAALIGVERPTTDRSVASCAES